MHPSRMVLRLCLYLCLGPLCLSCGVGGCGIHMGGWWGMHFCGPAGQGCGCLCGDLLSRSTSLFSRCRSCTAWSVSRAPLLLHYTLVFLGEAFASGIGGVFFARGFSWQRAHGSGFVLCRACRFIGVAVCCLQDACIPFRSGRLVARCLNGHCVCGLLCAVFFCRHLNHARHGLTHPPLHSIGPPPRAHYPVCLRAA
ncbi:hypothetical protein JB92DRAFT_1978574 [Gautieria morchelliformis]|nr:hypothetical protein JB92DRAFT_1978574 [Gautieria morchelliformis]